MGTAVVIVLLGVVIVVALNNRNTRLRALHSTSCPQCGHHRHKHDNDKGCWSAVERHGNEIITICPCPTLARNITAPGGRTGAVVSDSHRVESA